LTAPATRLGRTIGTVHNGGRPATPSPAGRWPDPFSPAHSANDLLNRVHNRHQIKTGGRPKSTACFYLLIRKVCLSAFANQCKRAHAQQAQCRRFGDGCHHYR
jgi:hypothetical protein